MGVTDTLVASRNKESGKVQLTETDEETFQEIDRLADNGVNMADITKLKAAGFCTVLSVIQTTKKELCNIKGLSEAKVEKILDSATKIELANNFMSGQELLHRREKILKITTGSLQLDTLLKGGIESMAITELFGENRCGKTQLCHTMCVTAQMGKTTGGGAGKVCYIDTEGTFRPEKIQSIADRYKLNHDDVLNNIMYARAYTTEHLQQLLLLATARMIEEPFSLIVVDSVIALYRVDFSGRGELSERQQKLNKLLSTLMKIAEQFNLAVLITNQVMSDPAGGMSMAANPMKPAGGHILGHASTTRLFFRKGRGDQRICKVYDAPNLPESECIFQLTDTGVQDAAE